MTFTPVGFLGLLVLLPALQAEDKPEKQTPEQQYQELVKEIETAKRDLEKAFKEAETPQEKARVRQEGITQLSEYSPRFLALAEKNPKAPLAVDALIWVISSDRDLKYDPQSPRTKALKILLRDHDRSELKKVITKEEIAWRSFWNGGSTQGRISSRWELQGWPTLFLIDAKGVIRHKHVGSPDKKVLDEEIDKLIAEAEKTAAK